MTRFGHRRDYLRGKFLSEREAREGGIFEIPPGEQRFSARVAPDRHPD
jgi:hypothetical protein